MEDPKKQLVTKWPFLSFITYGNSEYIGVIQNVDTATTMIYDYGSLVGTENKRAYLELAEIWWAESNRKIPINLFLKKDWDAFKHTLRILNSKDAIIECGPYVSLLEMVPNRPKKRSITLVRRSQV